MVGHSSVPTILRELRPLEFWRLENPHPRLHMGASGFLFCGWGAALCLVSTSLDGYAEPTVGRTSSSSSSNRRRRRGSSSGSSRPRRQARSRTARAELTFSVSQVERRLREGRYAQRLSWSASVFLAATLECLTAKVLELAGNEARHSARRRITPELLDMAVHNNALLSGLFGTTTISQVAQPRR
ncbi:LOW QUALITY PROTEIN: histone H2A-Bbd type 1 [Urocitellus parryii]